MEELDDRVDCVLVALILPKAQYSKKLKQCDTKGKTINVNTIEPIKNEFSTMINNFRNKYKDSCILIDNQHGVIDLTNPDETQIKKLFE
jgi:hypothetical protein